MKTIVRYSFLFYFVVNILFAQDPIAIKLSEKEGLPDVEFYDILEDNEGFVWLAADKGLYRFDGKEYASYHHVDKRGLSVFGLKLDKNGQLWCNNISGQFFYVKNNTLELFLDLKNELKGELSEFFFLDNTLFIFSNSIIFSVDLQTKVRQKITLPISTKFPIIRAPFLFEEAIYFTADDTMFTINKSNNVEKKKVNLPFFGSNIFPKFFNFKSKSYLLLYDNLHNKNYFFEIVENHLKAIAIPKELQNNRIVTISENKEEVWFCTSNGIVIIDVDNDRAQLKNVFFKNDFITKSILDKNRTVWISTLNDGVFIVPNLQIKSYENIVDGEAISTVEKIAPTQIAIGTTKGNLFFIDLKEGKKDKVVVEKTRKIATLLFLKNENALLISTEGGFYSYSLQTKKIITLDYLHNAKDLQQIGNSNGIVYSGFDRATVFYLENNRIKKQNELNFSRAYRSFYDENNKKIYVSYVDNLIVYESDFTSKILTYNNKSITAKEICATSDGVVWIATFSEGILGYKDGKFIHKIDTSNGLKSVVIQELKSDKNAIWIVTDKGIQLFDAVSKKFKPSLLNDAANMGNAKGLIVNDQNILLVSQEAILEIEKNIQPKTYYPNEIYFKSLTINEKETLVQENYNLPYDSNRIKISFHTNGYFPDEELQYEYRLLGLNDQWIPIEKNINFINFNSLPSNSYVFEIRAKNGNHKYFMSKKISFQINLPYWKRWWFVLLVFLFIFGIIIVFYRNKLAIQEKEKELALRNAKFESELAVLKLENLKSQMNPHFIFNALNSIQEYIVLNQKHLASSYLAKFADLIRAYLNHSSKGYISLKEEIECLNIYLELEKLRFEEKFTYVIAIGDVNEEIKIPTMLIQPYVENAIKHGLLHKKEDRKLRVTFRMLLEEQMLQCVIIDNGIGREKATQLRQKKHLSFATQANQNRLELLNFGKEKKIGVTIEDVLNENNEIQGTKVILLIPIIK
ncbi:sensor histidine kinase [Flavobacterium sp.]|uniref:sensor histidine kinase n=1 Tax=Flavobacterium sp. TaxID=239 RepID=UPI0025C339E5|nr:sensor histidine kinase [Flavobacterium sp.]